MRAIKKGVADRYLASKNINPPTTPSQATKAWDRFRRKSRTSKLCYNEQYGLCGYSEISIDNLYPILDKQNNEISKFLGAHLEHVDPKSRNPLTTFSHSNLIISAVDDIKARGLVRKDVFGGHHKLKKYSDTSFVSPLWSNCRNYFHYESNGKVVPNEMLPNNREKAKARLTIYILNLNAPLLVNLRRTWLNELDKLILKASSKQELIDLAEIELSPINGTLRPFHSAQTQLLGQLGTRICNELGL
ncbi:retron system putative HNH endonuclease [Vibrio gallaecicus]|uniref:retron system putative HNH endonuclease n=1 Tax=Vibrio gallaecicus TaxID=552386 RepID=UPI0010C9594F|nr:retron system putative HNH endonuclease [Vibrio gallaecicus]MDN3617371.1 retron system putative HNH endonuclease [Vibrio gallaecicus]